MSDSSHDDALRDAHRAALAHARAGDWKAAHEIVQRESDPFSASIHAYLHRVEGDTANAAYWYRRANEPLATGAPEEELAALESRLESR